MVKQWITVGPVGKTPLITLNLDHVAALEQVGNTAGIVRMTGGDRLEVSWSDYDRLFAAVHGFAPPPPCPE